MTVSPRSFAVGRLKYYRNIFKCLGNGYLVFFKNDIWSGHIFFPFRIDRKISSRTKFLIDAHTVYEKISSTWSGN